MSEYHLLDAPEGKGVELKYDKNKVLQYFAGDILPLLITFAINEIQRSGKPLTVFDIVNPLTGKNFNMDEAQKIANTVYAQLQKEVASFVKPEEARIEEETLADIMPVYKVLPKGSRASQKEIKASDRNRAKFQAIVRQFLRSQKPSMQLVLLNRIQKHTPFMLMDPRRKMQSSMQYGYADLLRFLCNPVKSGEVYKFIKADPIGKRSDGTFINNPFYNPIQYDVPDERGNYLLEQLYNGSRTYYMKKFEELNFLRKELSTEKLSAQKKKEKLHAILVILKEIQDRRFDPVHLSKTLKGQERPMATYRKDHFFELLRQISTRKKEAPASYGKSAPSKTGVELTGSELKKVSKGRNKSHKRRPKSKARKHVSSSDEF